MNTFYQIIATVDGENIVLYDTENIADAQKRLEELKKTEEYDTLFIDDGIV